jgi:sugar phosphate isomerase/epimerase
MKTESITRRSFVQKGIAAAAALPALTAQAAGTERSKTKIFLFSKHLQWLDYTGMSETAAELGLDGLDLTVRPGGHVEPERVQDDLPRAAEAMRQAGLTLDMMTTAVRDPRDAQTGDVLSTAAGLGFRHYRMHWFKYDLNRPIPGQLDDLKPVCRDLAALNRQYGLLGAYQNHAGSNYVGAELWDLWTLLRDIDPQHLGCQYDIRHATVEGGLAWPTTFKLMAPHITSLCAKDFYWHKSDRGWRAENCPLGEGMVDFSGYLKMLKQAGLEAPISLHLEFEMGGAEHGRRELSIPRKQVLAQMRREIDTLRSLLVEAAL